MTVSTMVVLLILLVIIGFAIKHVKKTKGCDCGCGSCPHSGSCHSNK